ncbi:hypothetical protein BDW68DRAFT_178712 [Aspergillus falconensis]
MDRRGHPNAIVIDNLSSPTTTNSLYEYIVRYCGLGSAEINIVPGGPHNPNGNVALVTS